MRIRLFTSIATCVLASGLSGCHIQSTLVTPALASLPFAAPGQILEFRAFGPNAPTSYVVFYGTSPCAESYYPIEPNKPARCKVRNGLSGYFEYDFETTKPPKGKFLFAKSCQYCQVIAVGPVNSGSASSSQTSGGTDSSKNNDSKTGSKTSAGSGRPYPPLPVSCDLDKKVASVNNSSIPNGVQPQDTISWVPINPAQAVTVTMPSGICSGSSVVFTAYDACTVIGSPGTYPYNVSTDNCPTGTGTLTINPAP